MYADIKISLKVGSVADVAEAVIKGKVDLGFLEEQFSDPLIQDSNLPGDRLVLVVAETHPWGARRKVSVHELMSEMWIMREKGTEAGESVRNSLSRINIDVGQIKDTLELPTDEAVIAAVEGGAGVAVVSSFAMQGRTKLRSINIGLEPRHFRVIYHRERSKTVVQQALLKMMANWPSQSPESQPIPFVRNSASLRRALT
jgi:DNA-binding transcriptional LysR family regulator